MPYGLQITEQALAKVRNRAVLPVLAVGLQSASADVRAAAIRASIRRHDRESHTQLLRLLPNLADADRVVLREAHQAMPHHAAPALKTAILSGDPALCGHACEMILLCRGYDLFPTLVKALEDQNCPQADQIAATLLQMAIALHDAVISWAKGERSRPDPSFDRHHVIAALESSLKRKAARHAAALVDAFLLLAPSDNRELIEMMRDARHPCHARLVSELSTDTKPAAMERLVALLRDTEAPQAAVEAIGRRADRPFVTYLLHELKHPVPLRVLHNMKRVRAVAWLEGGRDVLLELDGRAQAIAVDLAMASDIDRGVLFDFLKLMLQRGLGEGRRASCLALAGFSEPEANELIVAALQDPNSGVQAAALRQLRPRRIPDALQILVARLDSPHGEVRDAARSSLAEFNFVRYRAMFDLLDEQAARTTGALVRQVDQSALNKLRDELASPSASARVRGIEMAVAMGAAEEVREQLIALTRHENASLRKEAVTALAFSAGAGVHEALDLAARDPNRSVADAARNSLAQLKASNVNTPGTADPKGPIP
jgi:HEAT repeat protein